MPCYVERTGFTGAPPPARRAASLPVPRPVQGRGVAAAREATPAPSPRPSAGGPSTASDRKVVAAARLSTGLLGVPSRLTRDDATDAERKLASGWAKVAARPLNSGFAGQRFPLEQRNAALSRKYPESVTFDQEGFPDFTPYARATVTLGSLHSSEDDRDVASISRTADFSEADRIAGWSPTDRRAARLTWHHVQDGQTLMLVPSDLHQAVSHHGGVARAERVSGPQALITNYVLDALRED